TRAQQQGKLPHIGVLVSASPPHPFADAFWRSLHALGYSEGRNVKVEFRYTDARSDRAEEYAEDLVRLGVDVIVAHFVPAVEAIVGRNRQLKSARRKRYRLISDGCGDWRQTPAGPPRAHSEP